MEEESQESKLIKLAEDAIKRQTVNGLNTNNIDILVKLSKIKHYAKEDENMNNYGNYSGRGPGHGAYGNYGEYGRDNYGEYGRRGYDMKYRGHEHIDRMAGEYGRYNENKERYGAGEETNKSFHYMLESLKDFIKVLHEEAETSQQKQELMQALQSSMR